MKHPWTAALLLWAGCTLNPPPADQCVATAHPAAVAVPRLDHHQHLLSEGGHRVTVDYLHSTGNAYASVAEREPLVDADQLVQMLDEAGIPQALVFSNAYHFARHATEQPGEYEQAIAESDWTVAQVRRHPDRLRAACSVNPLRRYALAEIDRCVASGAFSALKVHFDASGVDVRNPAHVASVRNAFAAANRLGMPIVAHLQSEAGPYGGRQARIFLTEIMPAAPDVPVTINHLWGGGLYDRGSAAALKEFAEAFQRGDPATANLWFDLAQAGMMARTTRHRAQVVERMRQIGFERLLYGSDGPQWSGTPPAQQWDELKACLPLTRDELEAVAANVAPYLR